MDNVALVTETLTKKFQGTNYETLEIVKTLKGSLFLTTDTGFWRVYKYKSELKGYELPDNESMVYEAGKAFATFTSSLSDVVPDRLSITIPRFHSLEHRMKQYREALSKYTGSKYQILTLMEKVDQNFKRYVVLEQAMHEGNIPLRVTHNDSKFNNLLFDSKRYARCVVDLDTIMPGIIHFDIGDCLRTLMPNIPEDIPDINNLELNVEFQKAFLNGYLESGSDWITDTERELIPLSAPYMALIMGIRFLTDYLNGNVYFSCSYPDHNLVRAKNQITLCDLLGKIYSNES